MKQHTLHTIRARFTIQQNIDDHQSSQIQESNAKILDGTTHPNIQESQILVKSVLTHDGVLSQETKTTNTKQKYQRQPKQKITMDRTKSAEWTVVKEKKKHSTLVSPQPPLTKEKRRKSIPTRSTLKNSKSNSKRQNNANTSNTKPISDHCKTAKTTISNHVPWSNIVKSQEDDSESLDHDDVPHLSDSESTTGSVESPCMSHMDLFHYPSAAVRAERVQKENKYYSPFSSTVFDFGVLPTCQSQPQPRVIGNEVTNPSSIDNRLDEYLNSQQSYWNGSKKYTPSNVTRHQRSILDLLQQSHHVETTITPTSFSYFDDMMMSTSLYKADQNANKYPLLMSINKRDWNSISRHTQ